MNVYLVMSEYLIGMVSDNELWFMELGIGGKGLVFINIFRVVLFNNG